jgi:hypothetical protein
VTLKITSSSIGDDDMDGTRENPAGETFSFFFIFFAFVHN